MKQPSLHKWRQLGVIPITPLIKRARDGRSKLRKRSKITSIHGSAIHHMDNKAMNVYFLCLLRDKLSLNDDID